MTIFFKNRRVGLAHLLFSQPMWETKPEEGITLASLPGFENRT